jgi:hypothetical protein
MQNLLKNFREAIRNKGNQTWKLVGLLEVVRYKESLMLVLVELLGHHEGAATGDHSHWAQ